MEKSVLKFVGIGIFSLIFIFNLFFIVACSDEEVRTEPLSFESFEVLGQIHNDFLSKVENDFEPDQKIVALDEGLDYILKFQLDYLESTKISDKEKSRLQKALTNHKTLLVFDRTYQDLTSTNINNGRTSDNSQSYSMQDAIENAYKNKLIDEFEYESLSKLRSKVIQSYEGEISETELKEYLINLKNNWLNQGYTVDFPNGRIMAYTLAISISSLQWWEDHALTGVSENANGRVMALPAWAALDIGGALVSGAIAASGQYTLTGEVNWEVVGWSAAGGAVSSSTGVVGKIGKWIGGLF